MDKEHREVAQRLRRVVPIVGFMAILMFVLSLTMSSALEGRSSHFMAFIGVLAIGGLIGGIALMKKVINRGNESVGLIAIAIVIASASILGSSFPALIAAILNLIA